MEVLKLFQHGSEKFVFTHARTHTMKKGQYQVYLQQPTHTGHQDQSGFIQ